ECVGDRGSGGGERRSKQARQPPAAVLATAAPPVSVLALGHPPDRGADEDSRALAQHRIEPGLPERLLRRRQGEVVGSRQAPHGRRGQHGGCRRRRPPRHPRPPPAPPPLTPPPHSTPAPPTL